MMITEAGRAMTAHHAVMVVNVSEVEPAPEGSVPPTKPGEPSVFRHLREAHAALDTRPALELYLEAQQALSEGQACMRSASFRWTSARNSTICSTPWPMACARA